MFLQHYLKSHVQNCTKHRVLAPIVWKPHDAFLTELLDLKDEEILGNSLLRRCVVYQTQVDKTVNIAMKEK